MENIEAKKRVVEDELQIDGRTFRLRSFDPLLGNYILTKLLTTVLPMGLGGVISKAAGTEAIPQDTAKATEMSKRDFLELQRDILSHCDEMLAAGPAPVIRENGTYGVSGLTMKITIQLLIACIAFNFNDFFEESQSMLEDILPDLQSANTET